jgi:hypothetical protein
VNIRDKIVVFKRFDQLNITSEATTLTASETVKAETIDVVNVSGHAEEFKDLSQPEFE